MGSAETCLFELADAGNAREGAIKQSVFANQQLPTVKLCKRLEGLRGGVLRCRTLGMQQLEVPTGQQTVLHTAADSTSRSKHHLDCIDGPADLDEGAASQHSTASRSFGCLHLLSSIDCHSHSSDAQQDQVRLHRSFSTTEAV